MGINKNKGEFVPADRHLNTDAKLQRKGAQAAKHTKKIMAYNRTIDLLEEMKAASDVTWSHHRRTLTRAYARHIITGEALGRGVTIPRDAKDTVRIAARQACEEFGYQLPARKQPTRKKKR